MNEASEYTFSRICGWRCPECGNVELLGWNTDSMPPICVNVTFHEIREDAVYMEVFNFTRSDREVMAETLMVHRTLQGAASG